MDFSMTAEAIGATVTGTVALGGIVMYVVRSEFAKFSLTIRDAMILQQKEMQKWVNGSFMRSATVGAQLDAMSEKFEDLAKRTEDIEKRLDGHMLSSSRRSQS